MSQFVHQIELWSFTQLNTNSDVTATTHREAVKGHSTHHSCRNSAATSDTTATNTAATTAVTAANTATAATTNQ